MDLKKACAGCPQEDQCIESKQGPLKDTKPVMDPLWSVISNEYKVIEVIGRGSNCSEVVRAKRISDGVNVAIKLMKNIFRNDYACR